MPPAAGGHGRPDADPGNARDGATAGMESSTVIAFCGVVMLACLIVVPLAAIFGSQFPDVVKSVLIDHIWPPGQKTTTATPFGQSDAPPFAAGQWPNWHASTERAARPLTRRPVTNPPPGHLTRHPATNPPPGH